ncbi:di-trans,poly-cis-decaprenylcistransferase [Catonella morbi ATCC 51271]|uniref:Isoprenyl transferase n=1 Tax=Catonella morbi ATCC 51271 TaxID=592026 RepID=V2Y8W9_9FIRM|nr:polyprenyl diphosphate synthase [Catonella morbi]ESL04562.1 di-trans,poly-cis-decaprenylcistransferase [Catonella morbi ATCC 51271]
MNTNEKIPTHVAIILDGNGRWAKKRGLPRNFGHLKGCDNVEPVCKAAFNIGIKYVTMYAFSTENWKRPQAEVDELMKLLAKYMKDAMKLSVKNNMRVRIIGDKTGLSDELNKLITELEELSGDFTGLQLQIAVNYGGRDDIRRAFKNIILEADKSGKTYNELADSLTEEVISKNLDTADIPDPDLMIRTSGEQRLSNYLIWQLAYAEYFFTDTLWPDFGKKDLEEAIEFYSGRDRRFGGLKKG